MENIIKIKNEFQGVYHFIQKHTSKVCPLCMIVCCIEKHGHYDRDDLDFFSAIGFSVPLYEPRRRDTNLCRFLDGNGCSLERWMRPFRCIWYFCEPLLHSMREDSGRAYREFINYFQNIMSLRQKVIQATRYR